MVFINISNNNNSKISVNTTKITYDRSKFKPTMWCDKQWKNLKSDCKGLSDIVKRILIFIPLVFASLFAYPLSLICCTRITTTSINSPHIATIHGSGILATQKQDLKPYQITEVDLQSQGNLFIKKGNENSLTLNTDDNIIDQLESRVEGSKLILTTKPGSFQFQHLPTYTLIIPSDVSFLSVSGSGDITMDELTADEFSCKISGSGKINILEGIVNHQKVVISGSGEYIAPNLLGINSHIDISGSGSAVVQAKEGLKVNIRGSGECVYFGNPQITKHISGSGSIQKA